MSEVSIIGLDLAKNVFQVHGATAQGERQFNKKITRSRMHKFFSSQPPCLVAMEACSSAHYWAREIATFGHDVRLIPPAYVKPFVKRQKNDAADAEAISEAASRPNMRFVAVKTVDKQAACMAFRTRDLFVRQKTQLINALRGHLSEYGVIAPQGISHVDKLKAVVEEKDNNLPTAVVLYCEMILGQIAQLEDMIKELELEIRTGAKQDDLQKRLMTIPGIGPITAAAITAYAPPPETFSKGRDFAAWIGITPRQFSSGGKQKLGRITRMGQRDLRRLLITGAMAVVRWAVRREPVKGSWLAGMLVRKPRMLVAVALANRMARIVWAIMAHGGSFRDPIAS